MTPKRPRYIREERNGKVVYVPNSLSHSDSSPRRRASSRPAYSIGSLTGGLLAGVGIFCDRWFPPIMLTGAAGLTFGLGWLGWQAITNPDMIYWINQFTPGNLNRLIPAEDQPKTIDQVLAQLKRNGKNPGDPIALQADFSFYSKLENATAIAIPLITQREGSGCGSGCDAIQAIQVYRMLELPKLIQLFQKQRRFRKASRINIGGPSKEDLNRLIRTLTREGSSEGNSSAMALTDIKVDEQVGHRWLLLSGVQSTGSAQASFGQILRVNPKRSQLNVMVNWLSPSGRSPAWEDVTGDGQLDIVIEQSIELEPSFNVYEINNAPNGEVWVTPISLSKAAINTQNYQDALRLAKNGLWQQAQTQLEAIKANRDDWTDTAQSQLAFIQLHTTELDQNAELAFSDPVSEIQALLIRGQWQQAQTKILSSRNIYDAVEVVLESDNGQLGDRIHTAAQVGADKAAAIDWGIIYHYARGGQKQAQSWVQTHHPQAKSRLKPLFKKLSFPIQKKTDVTSSEVEASQASEQSPNSP